MATSRFSNLLERLVVKFCSWDDACGYAPAQLQVGVLPAERAALLDELAALRQAYSTGDQKRKSMIFDVFSSWAAPARTDLHGCETALLGEYERLCDLDLPLRISSVLLRHYSILKRASHTPTSTARASANPVVQVATRLEASMQAH